MLGYGSSPVKAFAFSRFFRTRAFVFFVLFFYGNNFTNALNVTSTNKAVSEIAVSFGELLPEAVNTGLSTADAYIGQLFSYPNHWSFGLTLTPLLVPSSNFADIAYQLFNAEIPPIYREKIIFPIYSFDWRLGGFLGWPFDAGFKLGFLPAVPLWGTVTWGYWMAGADLRIRVFYDRVSRAVASIAFVYSYMDGIIMGPYSNSVGTEIMASGEATAKFGWETNLIGLRFSASMPVSAKNITFFLGAIGGYALTDIKWRVNADPNGVFMVNVPASGSSYGGMYVNDPSYYEVTMYGDTPFAELYSGLSFDFRFLRLDFSLYANVIALTVGVRTAIRFQE